MKCAKRIVLKRKKQKVKINEALSISKAIGDKRDISTYLNNIGRILYDKSDLNEALNKYEESLIICKESSYKANIATLLIGIGAVFRSENQIIGVLS